MVSNLGNMEIWSVWRYSLDPAEQHADGPADHPAHHAPAHPVQQITVLDWKPRKPDSNSASRVGTVPAPACLLGISLFCPEMHRLWCRLPLPLPELAAAAESKDPLHCLVNMALVCLTDSAAFSSVALGLGGHQ